jgi:outer membrane protein assembly factor BamB
MPPLCPNIRAMSPDRRVTDRLRRLLALSAATAILGSACASAAATTSAPTSPATTATPASATLVFTPSPAGSVTPYLAASPLAPGDWPVYHLDPERSGNDPAFPAFHGSLVEAWAVHLDGAVYAQPLVVHGRVIAATEGDSVYALDPTSGAVVWRQNVGTPVRRSTLPCGNIDPLGITGTPAYDPATRSLFAVAEVSGPRHELFALDADSGAVLWSRNVDLPGDDPTTHQQRPALAVANGYVYIGFGGLDGDCGQYTGKVVGVPTSGRGATISYRVPVQREGAVWATGGPAVDASGNLYVSTGNGSSTTEYDGSDSVIELSPGLQVISRFAPAQWAADNARDADLGSLSPMLLPNGFVFIAGKSGIGYVLRQGALGEIGGQISMARVCDGEAFGAAARSGTAIFVPCSEGIHQVDVSGMGALAIGWQTTTGAAGPPVVGGGAVWSLDIVDGRLFALDPATGSSLGSIAVGALPHFASPSLWRDRILVGTQSGVAEIQAG